MKLYFEKIYSIGAVLLLQLSSWSGVSAEEEVIWNQPSRLNTHETIEAQHGTCRLKMQVHTIGDLLPGSQWNDLA